MGLLPGRPLGFEKWMRRLFANLAVFPATAFLLVTAAVLMNVYQFQSSKSDFEAPFVGGLDPKTIGSLIAFGILLVAPGIVGIIKSGVNAVGRQGSMATTAIAGSLAAGAAGPKGLGKTVWNRGFAPYNPYTNRTGWAHRLVAGMRPQSLRYRLYHKFINTALPKNKTYAPGGTTTDVNPDEGKTT
jgi:hypothetical protein